MNTSIEYLKAQGFSEDKAKEIFWRFALVEYLRNQGFSEEQIQSFKAAHNCK